MTMPVAHKSQIVNNINQIFFVEHNGYERYGNTDNELGRLITIEVGVSMSVMSSLLLQTYELCYFTNSSVYQFLRGRPEALPGFETVFS